MKTYEAFNFNQVDKQPIDINRLINDMPLADCFNYFVKTNRLDRIKVSQMEQFEKVRKKLAQLQVFNGFLDDVEKADVNTRLRNATRLDELCSEIIQNDLNIKQLD